MVVERFDEASLGDDEPLAQSGRGIKGEERVAQECGVEELGAVVNEASRLA